MIAESLLIILGVAIAAQVSPPDSYSRLLGTGVVAVALPVSYWIVYHTDYSRLLPPITIPVAGDRQ